MNGIAQNGVVKNKIAKDENVNKELSVSEKLSLDKEPNAKSPENGPSDNQKKQPESPKPEEAKKLDATKETKKEEQPKEAKTSENSKQADNKTAENPDEPVTKENNGAKLEAALADIAKDVKKNDMNMKEKKKECRSSAKNLDLNMQIKIEPSLQKLRLDESKKKKLTFEECLENGRQMMIKFLDNQFEETIGILEDQSDISIIHKLGSAAVRFFDALLSMDKEKMTIALAAMREAADFSDRHRKKTGYINYLISPDYNTFTDVECHAELCYATSQLVLGLLIALEDQSIYGFINGGLKIRMAHSSFRECAYIFKNKFNWDSTIARMHFESGTRLGIGSFDLIISFFPTKLAKLLEYIGFHSDRDLAIDELTQAVNLVDGLYYDISSILLSAYYGFLGLF